MRVRKYPITVATMFTIARIVLTPIIMWLITIYYFKAALIVFVIAASTDVVDGFIARYFNQKTFLGACLDPVADKILVCFCFLTLYVVLNWHIPLWFICLMIGKELLQIIGALILYFQCGINKNIEANKWGKITTFLQILCIAYILGIHLLNISCNNALLNKFFVLISILMVITMVQYGYIWYCRLKKDKDFADE